jgi:hypothetical protein
VRDQLSVRIPAAHHVFRRNGTRNLSNPKWEAITFLIYFWCL